MNIKNKTAGHAGIACFSFALKGNRAGSPHFKIVRFKWWEHVTSLPKDEQALYDKAHISRDIKNQCFTWVGIMLVGAVLSYFLTPYMAIPAFIIWLVLFFKEVHFDTHKAFEKYLLK